MDQAKRIGILVVNHHNSIRDSMAVFFESFPEFDLVGEATNVNDALRTAMAVKPDVVLLDLNTPGVSGPEAIHILHRGHPNAAIIAMLGFHDRYLPEEIRRNGAVGYLRKDAPIDRLAAEIRSAHAATQRRLDQPPDEESNSGNLDETRTRGEPDSS